MQALDVQQEDAALGPEARTQRGARGGAPQREGIGHGWVDDREAPQGNVQIAGPVEQRLRIEGDVGGVPVEAPEAVVPAIVVPHERAGLPPRLGRLQRLRQAGAAQPRGAPAHVRRVGPAALTAEGEEARGVAPLGERPAEQVGEQRVGGLVGREVRRHHQHVHARASHSARNWP